MKQNIDYHKPRITGEKRELVIRRDGSKCVLCGMTRQEHLLKFGRDITINHKDGNGRGKVDPNNSIDNLETMCLPCHGRKDIQRRTPWKDWAETSKKKSLSNLKYQQP